VNKIEPDIAYQNLCRNLVKFFDIGILTWNKEDLSLLITEVDTQIELILCDEHVPRNQKYNCAIVAGLIKYFPSYASQRSTDIQKNVHILRKALGRASLSDADACIVEAIIHQFETNEVIPFDSDVARAATPDLYHAAQYIQALAPYIASEASNPPA
jgi:hypothetical protein